MPMTVLPSASRNSLGGRSASVPMVMVPGILDLRRDLGDQGRVDGRGRWLDVVADAELEPPVESESEPQAVRARAVVATAASD